jgi:hypothetical protein
MLNYFLQMVSLYGRALKQKTIASELASKQYVFTFYQFLGWT